MFTVTVFLPSGQSFLNEGGPEYSYAEAMDRLWMWLNAGLHAEINWETRVS